MPGRADRAWMDATPDRFAYRCLPLSIANSFGWELLLPCRVEATWNGGPELADLTIAIHDAEGAQRPIATSHFGSGVLTFHVGYLFRTEPGLGLWVGGPPNAPKDGVAPLDGLVETDWLPFTFTMNWKLTRPGTVVFERDEPCCFITPMPYRALDDLVPEIAPLASNPELEAAFGQWRDARTDFNARLAAGEEAAVTQGWQKWYMRGELPDGGKPQPRHLSKLNLAMPRRSDDD